MACKLLITTTLPGTTNSISLSTNMNSSMTVTMAHRRRKLPKNLQSPRRSKLPPDFGVNLFLKKPISNAEGCNPRELVEEEESEGDEENVQEYDVIGWESEEIEAISSLFQGRIPQKPGGNLSRERPLPLPLPYKLRPPGFPSNKKHVKLASRDFITSRVYRNPEFLISLAREIKNLGSGDDVCLVLDEYARLLRKGSLSLTIRELGRMGLPERALQTFCWAQRQPLLFPDDRILASTVEVLARHRDLKMPLHLQKLISLASRGVIEAMVRGLIRGGSLRLAWELLLAAQQDKRMLDPSVYAKLILVLGNNPDKQELVEVLLDGLGEREDLNLSQQDCTALMKVCIRFRKFNVVDSLFHWFKQSGRKPSVVMYTTLIHSRYTEKKYREALAVIWEMEESNCLFDLSAYRVAIKLFVALKDLSRAVRYFAKLKEAGFSPTYDIYRDMVTLHMISGRIAKCKEIWKEAEISGFEFDKRLTSELLQYESKTMLEL